MRDTFVNKCGMYQHYKGKIYVTDGTAKHTETGETLVLYHRIGEHEIYARPETMFHEEVEVNDEMVKRFKRI